MKKITLSIIILLIFTNLNIFAAPFKNIERIMVQPNGDTLVCYASGDEFYNRLHDENDFTIVQNENGFFVYADKNADNQIIATNYVVGTVNPASLGLQPGIRISHDDLRKKYEAMHLDEYFEMKRNMRDGETNHGVFSNLTVFIRFKNDTEIQTPASTVNAMFNGNNDEDESMRKFYKQFSYNQIHINSYFYPEFNGDIVMSYEDIYTRNYYRPYNASTNPIGYLPEERAEREFDLLQRAIEYVTPMIPEDLNIDCNNDGVVDNMVFVVKGNVGDWSDLLWPHQWWFYERDIFIHGIKVMNFNFQLESATNYFTVSTLCHEMFHSLGSPDLYHYYDPYNLDPAGPWDLMCSSSDPPQSSCVWLKYKYGNWIDEIETISEYGTYTLEANTWEGGRRNGYLIPTSHLSQYYLIQYRDKNNFYDNGVPGSGITITRIDTRFSGGANFNGYDIFDEVYVFQPKGSQYVQGAVNSAHFSEKVNRTEFNKDTPAYPWLTGDKIDEDFNICNIKTIGNQMQFTYCPINYQIIPNNLIVNVINNSQVDLRWDNVEGASSYKVYRDEQLVANNITQNHYSEIGNIGNGYHEYYVTAIVGNEESYNSEKQYVILGALAEISVQMTAEMKEGWRGAEVELSFNNGMATQHYTIYNGENSEKLKKIIVPAGTEVTAKWYGGWEQEKCHFSLSDGHTSLTDNDFKNGETIRTFIAGESAVCATPQNLIATVTDNNVVLNWTTFVETDSYTVKRDGEVVGETTTSSFVDDNLTGSGRKFYEVASCNGQSEWTSVNAFVICHNIAKPELEGNYGFDNVSLNWNSPDIFGELNYVNDDYLKNEGSSSATWAIRFMPENLQIFDGEKLTTLEMFDGTAGNFTFTIYNGENTTANSQVFTEDFVMTGCKQWVKLNLSEKVAFDASQPLWITVKSKGIQKPGPVCHFTGNDNSALIKSGSKWKTLTDFSLNYSWMLKAYTEISGNVKYNIYRNGEIIANNVESTSYIDENLENNRYCYNVAVVLNDKEYSTSDEICGNTDLNEIPEKTNAVYPNPAEETLNIAGDFEYYEIYNAAGMKIIVANDAAISVKEWQSGIYMIRIFKKDGNTLTEKVVKR